MKSEQIASVFRQIWVFQTLTKKVEVIQILERRNYLGNIIFIISGTDAKLNHGRIPTEDRRSTHTESGRNGVRCGVLITEMTET